MSSRALRNYKIVDKALKKLRKLNSELVAASMASVSINASLEERTMKEIKLQCVRTAYEIFWESSSSHKKPSVDQVLKKA
jgi:hypothetical protein